MYAIYKKGVHSWWWHSKLSHQSEGQEGLEGQRTVQCTKRIIRHQTLEIQNWTQGRFWTERGSRERWEAAYSDARGPGTLRRCCRGRGWWRGAAPRATSAPCPTRCPAAQSRTARSPCPRPRTRRNTRVWFGRSRRRGPAETFRSQRSNEKCSPESRSSN